MEQLNYSKRAGIFCIVNALLKHFAQVALRSVLRVPGAWSKSSSPASLFCPAASWFGNEASLFCPAASWFGDEASSFCPAASWFGDEPSLFCPAASLFDNEAS